MFGRNKIDIGMINPSSKMSLKISCLRACGNNRQEAKELYEFIAADMNLPDFDVPPPSVMQQVTQTAGGLFEWVKQNQGDLMQAWNFLQSMKNGTPMPAPAPMAPPVDVPPIPVPQ